MENGGSKYKKMRKLDFKPGSEPLRGLRSGLRGLRGLRRLRGLRGLRDLRGLNIFQSLNHKRSDLSAFV